MATAQSVKLNAEQLDDRVVPAVFNLTNQGAQAAANGFIVQQAAIPAANLHTFVRLDGNFREEGFNTTARRPQFDDAQRASQGLTLGQVPVVNVNGVAYREFILTIRQNAALPLLSLDKVQIFLGNRADLNNYNANRDTLNGQRAVFDLDEARNNTVVLNSRVTRGNDTSDMVLLVPNSAFDGASANTFVYLYSQFGGVLGAWANGGAESWAVRTVTPPTVPPTVPPPPPPPAATSSLSGQIWAVPGQDGTLDSTDLALSGGTVVQETTTDINGAYSFNNLAAGTYTVREVRPSTSSRGDLGDGADYIGSLGGSTGLDDFGNDEFVINVGSNQQGVNYNFTHVYVDA